MLAGLDILLSAIVLLFVTVIFDLYGMLLLDLLVSFFWFAEQKSQNIRNYRPDIDICGILLLIISCGHNRHNLLF